MSSVDLLLTMVDSQITKETPATDETESSVDCPKLVPNIVPLEEVEHYVGEDLDVEVASDDIVSGLLTIEKMLREQTKAVELMRMRIGREKRTDRRGRNWRTASSALMRRNVEAVQTVDRAHGKIDTLCSTIVRRWKAAGFDQPDRYNVNSTRAECPVLQSQLNAEDIISLDSECYGVDVPNDSNYDDNKMEVLEVYGGAGCFETASRGNNGQTTIASLLGDIDSIKKSVLNREV